MNVLREPMEDDNAKRKGVRACRRLPASPLAVALCLMFGLLAAANLSSTLLATIFLDVSHTSAPPVSTSPSESKSSHMGGGARAVADAVAFIIIGDLATGPAPLIAAEALRGRGAWRGPVVFLTDHARCLKDSLSRGMGFDEETTLVVPVTGLPQRKGSRADQDKWLLAVKSLKTRLFSLIIPTVPAAAQWNFILYLDVDVWVAQPLQPGFLDAVGPLLQSMRRRPRQTIMGQRRLVDLPAALSSSESSLLSHQVVAPSAAASAASAASNSVGWTNRTTSLVRTSSNRRLRVGAGAPLDADSIPWIALFADCAAHAVGWCAGCETWNTGVMLVPNHSPAAAAGGGSYHEVAAQCFERWRAVMESGRFNTDQEALEAAVAEAPRLTSSASERLCDGVVTIPDPGMRHLLFMKDYLAFPGLALGMTGGGDSGRGGWPTFCHVTAANRIETQDWLYVRLAHWLHSSLGLRAPFGASAKYLAGDCIKEDTSTTT